MTVARTGRTRGLPTLVAFVAAAGVASTTAIARAAPSEPAAGAPSVAAAPSPEPQAAPDTKPARPRFPRLVVAAGPFIGPHAIGNEECRVELQECEKRGSFFGLGLQAELRVRLYKPLYVHGRGFIARNVSPNDRIYRGVGGGSLGLGAYGRRVFGRAEVQLLGAYGDNTFTPPFRDTASGRDVWGHTAGLFSAGFRQPLGARWGLELWGGFMVGPHSARTVPSEPADRRVLSTFVLGLNVSFDALP